MSRIHKYQPNDKMCNIISRNYFLIATMSRFGLPLGFGDKTIREICESHNVDCNTFLAVINFIEEEPISGYEYSSTDICISLPALVDYLKQAHSYFLDFSLPQIRDRLSEALDLEPERTDITRSILMFFDKYEEEVRRHMEYENKFVFDYVANLLNGKKSKTYSISNFAQKHNLIGQKLAELKNIIIKYYPQTQCNNLLNAALFDIFNCEADLNSHCRLEDEMFTPAVEQLENTLS